jgi:hypothetical protein
LLLLVLCIMSGNPFGPLEDTPTWPSPDVKFTTLNVLNL